ncbi:alpha/beta fold hydrolase [Rhodococcus sp. NPDC058521]|uniref:alpha/beta fold hydrolase n=1 Tax=Rhodococcus sp. NPDC058521 TaxID=3346536 RepID=UPI003647E1ED
MTHTHFVLVPGFWLGSWAWAAVAANLTERGHKVTALTLPGLESLETNKGDVTLEDHVTAVVNALKSNDTNSDDTHAESVVLVAHSGAGPVAYMASDRVHDRLDRVVYVDSGPMPSGARIREDVEGADSIPLPSWTELENDDNSLEGLDDAALETFRTRAVPQPAGPARDEVRVSDDRRLGVPVTVVCNSFPAEVIVQMAAAGHPMAVELESIESVEYVDLPTGHWPMWSRPDDLAEILHAVTLE